MIPGIGKFFEERWAGVRRWKVRKQVCLALGLGLTAFLLAWGFNQFILKTPVLTPFGEKPALTPLYAFWIPRIGWTAWVFPLFCIFFVVFAARFADAKRTGRGKFLLFLAVSSLALPLGLFLIRRPVSQLGFQFNIYPGEEFIFDAIRIQNLGDFLRGYVELMPRCLHGKHFPPGHATFLYIVQQFFGNSLLVAGMAVLAAFSSGTLMCYGAFKTLLNESAARWGALLLLASPLSPRFRLHFNGCRLLRLRGLGSLVEFLGFLWNPIDCSFRGGRCRSGTRRLFQFFRHPARVFPLIVLCL